MMANIDLLTYLDKIEIQTQNSKGFTSISDFPILILEFSIWKLDFSVQIFQFINLLLNLKAPYKTLSKYKLKFRDKPWIISRSSHLRCSVRKDVLRNFTKFTGKHLCQILLFNKVAGLESASLRATASEYPLKTTTSQNLLN